MWENFKQGWTEFSNSPVVISVVTILTILIAGLVILSRTSFGKKTLHKFGEKIESVKDKVLRVEKVAEETKQEVSDAKSEIHACYVETKEELDNKVVAVYSKFETFQDDVFKILEQIPNAKVQSQIKEVKEKATEKEEEIKKLLGDTYNDIQKQIDEEVIKRVSQVQEEANSKIDLLQGEINSLKELIKQSANVAVQADLTPQTEELGDGEQETNNQTED